MTGELCISTLRELKNEKCKKEEKSKSQSN